MHREYLDGRRQVALTCRYGNCYSVCRTADPQGRSGISESQAAHSGPICLDVARPAVRANRRPQGASLVSPRRSRCVARFANRGTDPVIEHLPAVPVALVVVVAAIAGDIVMTAARPRRCADDRHADTDAEAEGGGCPPRRGVHHTDLAFQKPRLPVLRAVEEHRVSQIGTVIRQR